MLWHAVVFARTIVVNRYLCLRAFSAVCIALSGCSLAPDFVRPETPVSSLQTYVSSNDNATATQSPTRWWERLNDPTLDRYIDQLLTQNFSLREAIERAIQAKERAAIQRGGFFPAIGTSADGSRIFQAADSFNIPGGGSSPTRFFNTNVGAELTASWELDIFGKVRNATASARSIAIATELDRIALEQSLIAELLRARVAIAINQRLLRLAKQNADSQQAIYDLVKRRYDFGAASTSLADVYLAEDALRSRRADVQEFERLLTDSYFTMDILLGQTPGTLARGQLPFPLLPPPQDVATCVPAALLDRRPDLLASEFRYMAANADIGVAIADLYPTLSLNGGIGFRGNETRNLFTADRLAGSLLGSITTRLFEGGALRANIRLEESEARELAAGYAGAVLDAMRDVESSLTAEQLIDKQVKEQGLSLEALKKAEKLTEKRYKQGIVTLRNYLETQQQRYITEQNYITTTQSRWDARIDLYLALGGDWLGHDDSMIENDCSQSASLDLRVGEDKS